MDPAKTLLRRTVWPFSAIRFRGQGFVLSLSILSAVTLQLTLLISPGCRRAVDPW